MGPGQDQTATPGSAPTALRGPSVCEADLYFCVNRFKDDLNQISCGIAFFPISMCVN